MIATGQSGPSPDPPAGTPVPVLTWPAFVEAWLAADWSLHACIRQAIAERPSCQLAQEAWKGGCPLTVVRALLLRGFLELLC